MSKVGLNTKIYMGDKKFLTTIGTHWVSYIDKFLVDFHGFTPRKILSDFSNGNYGECLFSEYKIRGTDSLCAASWFSFFI